MNDAEITIDQCRKLFLELGTNDAFRRLYEEKPAVALVELGIPADVVVKLSARCLESRPLAKKEIFQAASEQLEDEAIKQYTSFAPPLVSFGRSGRYPE